jgi:nucleoid-associated protein YgaU
MTKSEFIETLGKLAQAECAKRDKWVLPSVCIGQAALETGWGNSNLMTKANAFFGIKAGKNWTGKVYSADTQECYDGVNYTDITDTFRAYDSLEESVKDYYDLITNSSRYSAACNVNDAKTAITAIKNGGYATSPTYVTNVMSIINSNSLTNYDTVVTGAAASESVEDIAKEVLAGKWGNGIDRMNRLSAAGYDYAEVQQMVNSLVAGDSAISEQIEQTHEVVRGDTLSAIARKYNTTVAAILKDNRAKYPKITANYIVVGWVLKV